MHCVRLTPYDIKFEACLSDLCSKTLKKRDLVNMFVKSSACLLSGRFSGDKGFYGLEIQSSNLSESESYPTNTGCTFLFKLLIEILR